MSYSHYERLTALDATFLEIEDENVHMHVGAISIFEGGELLRADGSIDFARIRRISAPAMARNRRFRQRLEHVPLLGHPVWVDDARFNLDYHLRHTALPEPGDERQLKRLFGRLMSQKLDVHKPLWEMWFVEGLEGGRFAVISKIHHCMIDGVSGVDLIAMLMDPDAEADARRAEEEGALTARPWLPRPPPTPAELLAGEARRRAALPLEVLRAGVGAIAHPVESAERFRDQLEALRSFLAPGLEGGTHTPLNPDIGPHRRFDWLAMDLAEVKDVRRKLGGTLNDVVLATVAGAVRRLLEARGVRVDELGFRAQIPVNIRALDEHGQLGNRIAMLLADLPVAEGDPRKRHAAVVATTSHLKESHQARGAEILEQIGDWTAKEFLAAIARITGQRLAYNVVVTNVPGPPVSVQLLGARMTAIYPLVPLFANQAVGIALFSYDTGLFWGFNADWDSMPDLHDLVEAVRSEFALLRSL
ncbi:MAG: wax ester/triacylglycerol synthase family O-acyltransferase [Proteobacteria bacterium]|nr:MAG: wax ester/triacylglycerol synthase family O-acyltransferase [Pseudomonadota bacterium]